MNLILSKERRSLRPAFLATIGLTILSSLIFNGSDASGIVVFFYALGAVLMAASAFGNEFHSRTMLLLLSQPAPRRSLWLGKMRELGLELFISFVVLIISVCFVVRGGSAMNLFSFNTLALCFIPLCAFCTTPCFSIFCKNVLGALAFTPTFPYVLVMLVLVVDLIFTTLMGRDKLFFEVADERHHVVVVTVVVMAALAYCATLYRIGYSAFMEFQVVDSQSQELSLPAMVEKPLARWTAWLTPGYSSPFLSLIRKELRLQRPSFIVVGVCVVALPILALLWAIHHSPVLLSMMALPVICFFVMPFLTGLVTVAEERNMGVLAWQLTQPVSPRKQWLAKMLVAFCTCVALGLVFPGALFFGGHYLLFGPSVAGGVTYDLENGNAAGYCVFAAIYITLFSLVIFGSTISTNASRAMAAALGMIAACGSAIALGIYAGARTVHYWMPNGGITHIMHDSAIGDVLVSFMAIGSLIVIFGLAWLNRVSFANFRSDLPARRIWKQIVGITVYALITGFVMTLMFGSD